MKCWKNKLIAGSLFALSATSIVNAAELMVTNNLFLRLDGSDVTLNGSTVSAWNNQAVGPVVSADFMQTVSGAQPALIPNGLNGHPVLEFDGSADNFQNLSDSAWEWNYDVATNMNDAARWTMFFVCKPDVVTGNRFLLRSGYNDLNEGPGVIPNTALWGAWFSGDDYSIHCRTNTAGWLDARWSDNVDTEWHILGGVIQNTTDPAIIFYRDGDIKAIQNNDTTRQMGGHIRTRIGASSTNPTANEFFDGQLAEVLIYKEVLSDSEMIEVNRYLAKKYGFNDPYHLLYCRMDDEYVVRDGTNPPPALSTVDGDWTVVDEIEPAENGTAKAVSTDGWVLSSATGVIGEAIQFSNIIGGEHRVDFGDADTLEPGLGSLTVSLWFKASAGLTTTQFIASHGNLSSGSDGWSIWLDRTTLHFRCKSSGAYSDSNRAEKLYTGVVDGVWYHTVVVLDRDGNKVRAFVNGSQDGTSMNPTWTDTFESLAITSDNKQLQLGARNDQQAEFKGCVDDFSIWKRVLSANEIAEIYDLGVKGRSFMDEPPPIGTLIIIN